MIKLLYIFILFFTVSNCSLNDIEIKHGVALLENKQKNLNINEDNKNDIIKKLGPPSTLGFNNQNLLIYIEKKTTRSSILKLGKKKELIGNLLVIELDEKGILKDKRFYNLDDQNKLEFIENKTVVNDEDGFVYGVVSSLRNKIDSPKRKKKFNQR